MTARQVPRSRIVTFLMLSASALTWDLFSKSWVFAALGYPHRESDWSWSCPCLWGKFHIKFLTSFNQGALWGLGQGYGGVFAVLSVTAAACMLYWLFVRGEAKSWWLTISFALIMAGALGNLYDRLYLHGCAANGKELHGVRDFILCTIPLIGFERPFHFYLVPEYEWPIFNFADTYLVIGAGMLTLMSLRAPRPSPSTATESGSQPDHPAGPMSGPISTHAAQT